MKIEKVAFGGWKNCIQIDNGTIQIIVTTEVGPRVVSCGFKGKENLFFNNPAEMGTSGGKEYVGYGGHRLWLLRNWPNAPITMTTSPWKSKNSKTASS